MIFRRSVPAWKSCGGRERPSQGLREPAPQSRLIEALARAAWLCSPTSATDRANCCDSQQVAIRPLGAGRNTVFLSSQEIAMPEPECIDRHRATLIAYDVCRRALIPSDPTRRAAMRPVLDAWVKMIAAAREARVPVIYTTPVSRSDGADVVMLPTDLSAETGVPPLTNAIEGTAEAGFPDEIAPAPEDYVFLKRRPSAFYGTGVAELLHMLRRDTIIIGGGATNRGVETSVREAFNLDLPVSWCANAAGAATQPRTPIASTKR